MDAMVAERDAQWPVRQCAGPVRADAARVDESRQLEGLICAGALDGLEPDRATCCTMPTCCWPWRMLPAASAKAGRAGCSPARERQSSRPSPEGRTRLVARRTDGEGTGEFRLLFRRASGPAIRRRRIGQRRAHIPEPDGTAGVSGGGRQSAVMAAMVEKVNKGRTKRGADFVRADFSDSPASSAPPVSRKRWSRSSRHGPRTAPASCSRWNWIRPARTNRRASPCAVRARWTR